MLCAPQSNKVASRQLGFLRAASTLWTNILQSPALPCPATPLPLLPSCKLLGLIWDGVGIVPPPPRSRWDLYCKVAHFLYICCFLWVVGS